MRNMTHMKKRRNTHDINYLVRLCATTMIILSFVIKTTKYGAGRISYAAATLWNTLSDDGLKNSGHVDDFRKGLKTYLFKITFILVLSLFSFTFGPRYILALHIAVCLSLIKWLFSHNVVFFTSNLFIFSY